jgi:EAL domain-containing protein (putative c-di-GMP-specific phosphodiesterase class I)
VENKALTRLKIDVQKITQRFVKAIADRAKMKSYFIKD